MPCCATATAWSASSAESPSSGRGRRRRAAGRCRASRRAGPSGPVEPVAGGVNAVMLVRGGEPAVWLMRSGHRRCSRAGFWRHALLMLNPTIMPKCWRPLLMEIGCAISTKFCTPAPASSSTKNAISK